MSRTRGKMVATPIDTANELLTRYAHGRSIADLNEAISWLERALEITPPGAPSYVAALSSLGAALEALFSYSHDVGDLERAIGFLRQAREVTPPDTSAYATLLSNLAAGLSELGRRDEAAAASREAVDIRRRLAEADPEAYLPDLAMSLNNLATGLSELGRRDEAAAASREAVDIRRRLAEADPEAYLPDLAMSLNNLAAGLSELGRRDEAAAASREAVDIRRRLAEADPEAYLPDLAMSLNNLGIALSGAGRVGEATAASEEAVRLYRQLAADDPAAYEPSLARALSNLGNRMSDAGRVGEATAASEEAVRLYRQLAADDPAAYEPSLAMAMTNLRTLDGAHLPKRLAPRRDDAAAASREAVDIRRRLAEVNPEAYLPDLAMSLNNLGIALSGAGRVGEATAASEEAVRLYRQLAADDPAAYEPSLARALSNLGNRMSDAGRVGEATAASEEAVRLYRQLAADDPAAYEPSLARALSNLGNRMSDAGRVGEATAASEEAVRLYRQLAADDPAAYEPSPATLPGLEFPAADGPATADRAAADRGADDRDLAAVAAELRGLDGDGSRMAAAIRGALDMLLDGQHTGRYRWDQLHKTEKTHAGTLVEIALARALRLADGTALDYTIAGVDVDCKFSHRLGGWMIPPEADGKLMLLVQASDEGGTWSGLLRATEENLSQAGNRDGKRALSDRGRAAVRWLHARAPLQENALIRLPEPDVAAIFASASGQQRVNELFRRAQRMRVSRTVVATVAMQDDYMKRVRDGGGARDQLRAEGIVIFGDYAGDQVLAGALGLVRPGPGEFVSARLVRASGARDSRDYARSIRLAGVEWTLASADDPAGPAPALPR